MLAVALVFGRRGPARNPFVFAGAVFVFYAMIDAATGLAAAPAAEVFKPLFLIALTLAGLSGQAGAAMARRPS